MARASQWAKVNRPAKFSTRVVHRCKVCGRPRAFYRDFGLCRLCLRMLARIRNAALARHELTRLPASNLKHKVAELLKAEGYVSDVREEEWGPEKHRTLTIVLKYNDERECAFQGIRRVSRPGRRVYVRHD